MEDSEGDALADVAYGLFEIQLNAKLLERGHYLYELVEGGVDFWSDLEEIFQEFTEMYPQLAESLTRKFNTIATIYEQFRRGEGVTPSHTTQMYWIVQDAPGFLPGECETEKMGKWLIFLDPNETDAIWKKIRDATVEGRLGCSAKVSTAKPNPESTDSRQVIYVITADWEDEDDVMRIREELRTLGIEQKIGYKRNIETYLGEYSEKGKKVTFYSA